MVMRIYTDNELIDQIRTGDDSAYRVLVKRHQRDVARFIFKLIPNMSDREEVCQDVFIKVYFKLDQFKKEARFSTWLFRIAYRVALSKLRSQKQPEAVVSDAEAMVAGPDQELDAEEVKAQLQQAVAMIQLEFWIRPQA